jgi:hypothetical protein
MVAAHKQTRLEQAPQQFLAESRGGDFSRNDIEETLLQRRHALRVSAVE